MDTLETQYLLIFLNKIQKMQKKNFKDIAEAISLIKQESNSISSNSFAIKGTGNGLHYNWPIGEEKLYCNLRMQWLCKGSNEGAFRMCSYQLTRQDENGRAISYGINIPSYGVNFN